MDPKKEATTLMVESLVDQIEMMGVDENNRFAHITLKVLAGALLGDSDDELARVAVEHAKRSLAVLELMGVVKPK